jgi:FkbM family methyltransferase
MDFIGYDKINKISVINNDIIIKTYDGYQFKIRKYRDDVYYACLLKELYEYKNWFLKYVKGTFVDVGAYIGGYTVRASKLADFVIAIEPQPSIFKILSFNVKINGYSKKVKLINKAVWKDKGIIKMSIGGPTSFISNKGIEVEADTLDNILDGINKIDFMKIDIEGAELEAFDGMKKSLLKTKILMIEIIPKNLKEMYKRLKTMNFKLVDCISLDKRFPYYNRCPQQQITNYLFIK